MFSEKKGSIQFYLVIIGKICEIEPVGNSKRLRKEPRKGGIVQRSIFLKSRSITAKNHYLKIKPL